MPEFHYEAMDGDGASVRGEVRAASEIAALDQIANRGLIPVAISEGGRPLPWWAREVSLSGKARVAGPRDLEPFFAMLAAMLKAKLSLPRALQFCESQGRDKSFRRAIAAIRAEIEDGRSLTEALRGSGGLIPDRYAAFLELGERANRLEETAAAAAAMLKGEAALRRQVRSAFLYPMILMAMSALVLALLIFHLVPSLMPVFRSAGAAPPVALRVLDALRTTIVSDWPWLMTALAVITAGLLLLREPVARIWRTLLFRAPAIGPFLRQRESQRLCQTLAMVLESGAPLPRALEITRAATGLPTYQALLDEALSTVTAGGTLSQTLAASPLIAPLAQPLIRTGEESDRLAEMLRVAADTLAAETTVSVNRAVGLLTPILTLAIGLGIGSIILATISGIMDLNDLAF
ncbi:type II secretion system F family protein [Defluviimonas salinarum]|uniref:Type II secretion system F family protein n=1 Tax=Defluviimonas salinarum TaxID=2992147 RepID=A0ABT3J7B0_9RHOB|nr:type II secretion system F family protein [Defluviimonas salinarum]MCW3783540.1 type II secretion system F family protein [Defluviimonas salinarum]